LSEREEVSLWLGLMTWIAWIGMVIARREPGDPAMIWIANIPAALAFGWLFWRRGLVAAMVAHFVFDVVLKVIYPAVAD
jgi:hypothetical protein